jgi:hypothetical protein
MFQHMVYEMPGSSLLMRISDPVRIYEGEWFNEGHIIELTPGAVLVDFMDWKQRYSPSELVATYIHFKKVWVASAAGETVEDFRD